MLILADTSAWIWAQRDRDDEAARAFLLDVAHGVIAICDLVRLEYLRGIETRAGIESADAHLRRLPQVPIGPRAVDHAGAIQAELAEQGGSRHRSMPIADLLIAGAALEAGTVVLHRDRDYEAIAAVTGQPVRWLGPRP